MWEAREENGSVEMDYREVMIGWRVRLCRSESERVDE